MATAHDNTRFRGASDKRFSRQNRLLDKGSYGRVFKRARRSKDKYFTVLYRTNETGQGRLGLAVSKKNCRLAVGRNRLKRIIRESFRAHRGELTGIDIVVLNQPNTHTQKNKTLFDSLEKHWRRCRGIAQAGDLQDKG